jgi:hypothetical protein
MFVQARHYFDEIARFMPKIELFGKNFIPSISTGTRAAGQCK